MDHTARLETIPNDQPDTEAEMPRDEECSARRGPGLWGVLLVFVIVFGYLTAARRASLGKFAEQVADIVRDFRGYDPEF